MINGMFRVAIELVLALAGASFLDLPLWLGAAFVMLVMTVPALWAIGQNQGADLLALAVVFVTTGLVGGFAAPEGYHSVLWALGLLSCVTFLVAGLCLMSGIELRTVRSRTEDPPGHIDGKFLMS